MKQNAGHYVIAYFGLEGTDREIVVESLLIPEQVQEFQFSEFRKPLSLGDLAEVRGHVGRIGNRI